MLGRGGVSGQLSIFIHWTTWPATRWGGSARPWWASTAGSLSALTNHPARCLRHLQEEEGEGSVNQRSYRCNADAKAGGFRFAANCPLTHSEVDVAFASAHDQICFGIGGRRVRGFRRRIVWARVCRARRGHRLTCGSKWRDIFFLLLLFTGRWQRGEKTRAAAFLLYANQVVVCTDGFKSSCSKKALKFWSTASFSVC